MTLNSSTWLGLDLGTSALKAIVINSDGAVLAQASASLAVNNPRPLWSEQDPESWWGACQQAIAKLLDQDVDLANVQALAIAGHMHGATLIDADNHVLRPCILWNDGRCFDECATLEASLENFQELSGNLAMPGFTAPKLLWVARHEPEIFARIYKVLLPKSYLNWRLTGKYSCDMSDAAGTLWLNPARRAWSAELIAASKLKPDQLPELFEGNECIGSLTDVAAAELGLPVMPVMAGAGDNAAGALGVGVTEAGQAFVSLGTSGVYFVVSDTHRASPENTVHAFCHCLPRRWLQMSVSLSAANSLAWFADLVRMEVQELLDELEGSGLAQTPIVFLPYLSGERTPHNAPHATGAFFGMTNNSERAHMTLAVMEGVAYSFADGQAALQAAGTEIREVTLIGGGARSSRWRQMLADVLNRPLTFRDGGEFGPALGAARLARIGSTKRFDSQSVAEICQAPEISSVHEPDADKQDYYQRQLEKYRALYQQTKVLNG